MKLRAGLAKFGFEDGKKVVLGDEAAAFAVPGGN